MNVAQKKVDVLVYTAIPDEFKMVRKLLGAHEVQRRIRNPIGAKIEEFHYVTRNQTKINILLACPTAMGQIESAICSTYLLSKYKFKYIGITGIAGLAPLHLRKNKKFTDRYIYNNNVSLGDVIFADCVVNLDISKITKMARLDDLNYNEQNIRSTRINLECDIIEKFKKFSVTKHMIFNDFRYFQPKSYHPNILIAPIISTNQIIADNNAVFEFIDAAEKKYQNLHPIGFEMESYSVLKAAQYLQKGTHCFVIKGANDFSNQYKSHDEANWRLTALENSSIITINFIEYLFGS